MTTYSEPLALELDCPHLKIVPYGDGRFGRCTECGDDSFPFFEEAEEIVVPSQRDALLERLRSREAYKKAGSL